jgi:hypothetical protein
MINLILILVYLVYSFPDIFLYISNDDVSEDVDGCGVAFDRGCKSFSYVFQSRFNDTTLEKGLFLFNNHRLSDNNGIVIMDKETPGYYIFGSDYKLGTSSKVIIPSNSGSFACKYNVYFSHLDFESENGVFNYDNSSHSLIYGDVSGIEITIKNCSFTTSSGYNFDSGSNSRLIHITSGIKIIFESVIVNKFRNNGGSGSEFIRIFDTSSEVSLLGVYFSNLKTSNSPVIELKGGIMKLENSNFINIGQGGKPFIHAFFFYFFLFFFILLNLFYFLFYRDCSIPFLFVKNCSFSGAFSADWGAVFDAETRSLIIESCNFTDCRSTSRGFLFFFFFYL